MRNEFAQFNLREPVSGWKVVVGDILIMNLYVTILCQFLYIKSLIIESAPRCIPHTAG